MIRRTLLFLLVAGLALGASTGSVAFAGSSDDQDIADASILTEDDVADYGLEEGSPDDDELPPNVPACKKIRTLGKAADRRPSAVSAFTDNAGINAASKVIIYPSARAARAPVVAYTGDDGEECLGATLDRNIEAILDPGSDYEFEGGAVDVELGDSSIVYQIVVTITDEAGNISELYVELGLIQVGNGLAQLSFQAVDAPFEGSEDLATLVVDNLTANLDS
jgi:hypothetical protein